jgi:hypothetical protein
MKVYMVMFDWSTIDDEAVEVELFDTYEKAKTRFNEIIADENNPELSWVGSEAIDENGEINDGFDFEEHGDAGEYDRWWNITDKNDWNRHVFLDLKVMEVK